MCFHEHHLLADVRAGDTGSKTTSLRRSSSLGALSKGPAARSEDLPALPPLTELTRHRDRSGSSGCSSPLLSASSANRSMERMGSSNLQNLESSSVVYTEAGVSRVCVMELEVVNSADVGLQV